MPKTFEVEVGGRTLTFETGKMAAQASGAVSLTYGETGVLITAVGSYRLLGRYRFPAPHRKLHLHVYMQPVGSQGGFSGGKSGVPAKKRL